MLSPPPQLLAVLAVGLMVFQPSPEATAGSHSSAQVPLYQKSYEEIINNYTFINDFSVKEPEREVSSELFWRYPFKIPRVQFPIDFSHKSLTKEIPITRGTGRPYEHLNKGRISYFAKDYEIAKNIFLTARSRFGKTFKFHRRNDYFIGTAFMQLAEKNRLALKGDYQQDVVRSNFANAATFLSWAFIRKRDLPDPVLEALSPKGLYNLAAIYFKYDRFGGAHGAATSGLNFLRGSGKSDFRPQFRRMVAEGWIKNRSYLKAVQVLDTAVRSDPDPAQAASAFARVGDIYFDLNNYELAEDAYGLSISIDREKKRINPSQMILRGESLFWLGRFSDAQKMLSYGIKGVHSLQGTAPLPLNYAAWAKLRVSDAFLARAASLNHDQLNGFVPEGQQKIKGDETLKREALLKKAKLSYFQVESTYPGTEPAKIAKIRRACLELPFYAGKNIRHARELLEKSKKEKLPRPAVELSWACKTGSYAQRERSPQMLNRVKKFAKTYPDSRFLKSLVQPVKETQMAKLDAYFKGGHKHKAIRFFEKNRSLLFSKIKAKTRTRLFEAYVSILHPKKAAEFWPAYGKLRRTPKRLLKSVVFASEMVDLTPAAKLRSRKKWESLAKSLISDIKKINFNIPPNPVNQVYLERILAGSLGVQHLSWAYTVASKWAKSDDKFSCSTQYPILSKMVSQAKKISSISSPKLQVLAAVDVRLPGLLEINYACGSSLLELETQVLEGDVSGLRARWLSRMSWPLVPKIVSYFWGAAESLAAGGDLRSARVIWKHISRNGPADLPEVKYSKHRLDRKKTEFEGLWQ